MNRDELADLSSFAIVAQERSFTRAAVRLNISQSALSHTIKRLEDRLELRLLDRSTRKVSLTPAGERLLGTLAPALEDIASELSNLAGLRQSPGGTIRVTAPGHAARSIIMPQILRLTEQYPDLSVELTEDVSLPDIIGARFDAGVRIGEHLAQDVIAIPISPPLRLAIVAVPEFWRKHQIPKSPRDLPSDKCISYRRPSTGRVYEWEFSKDGVALSISPSGRLCFNTSALVLHASLSGHGIACVLEDEAEEHIQSGRLVRVLEDWCEAFPGYHLYYGSRRHNVAALKLLVEALRYDRGSQPAG
ncbi:LysR family transcriptional regulator [Pseudomonas sp. MYb118]|uniref:LysR family transcriptional regulator n=1 Tax=Pseudomonas sp. MYb118 TaxID=1848720 RepID=UPI0034CFBE65